MQKLLFLIFIIFLTNFFACKKDNNRPDILALSADSLTFVSAASNAKVNITTNTAWLITNIPAWLQVDAAEGKGNSVLTFSARADTTDTVRSAILFVTAGTLVKKITVIQNIGVKLLSYPNGNTFINDSIKLVFNQAVKVISIMPGFAYCGGDNNFTYFSNNRGVEFHYRCGSIGGDYPFTITVNDAFGVSTSIKFNVQYYTQKYVYNQHGITAILPCFLTNTGFWVSQSTDSGAPTILTCYSVADLSIIKTFQFNFRFAIANYNPYNHLFYIVGSGTNTIYEVDPGNGAIVKTVTLSPLPGDDPNSPQIYAGTNIKFFANGQGIFFASGQNVSNGKLKIIDTKNGDAISIVNTAFDMSQQTEFGVNYSGTEIYTHDWNNGSTVYKIDEQSLTVTSFIPPDASRIGVIIPSTFSDDQIYEVNDGTYIYNPLTNVSTELTTVQTLSDFTNQPGLSQTLYMCGGDDYFYVTDFSKQQTLYKYPTFPTTLGGFGAPFATQDGKHLFVIDGDSRTLYMFNTQCFFK